ncbi:MAG: penicillin-binding transpeptidase domain-containing protein, partial [Anaerolineae bacterium]
GINAVVDSGTAATVIDVPAIRVAGKTGTADFCRRYPQCLDRNGRVKDKHAWFVAYAPRENPEVATVVFVYDGGEGSQTAAPVVNKILRYYFKFDQLTANEADTPDEAELTANTLFVPRLLGSDAYPGLSAAIRGFVLDSRGEGLAGVAIDVVADGEVVVHLVSGPTGQFDYNAIDPLLAESWEIQLPALKTSAPLKLAVSAGTRYYLEFQMAKTAQDFMTTNDSG